MAAARTRRPGRRTKFSSPRRRSDQVQRGLPSASVFRSGRCRLFGPVALPGYSARPPGGSRVSRPHCGLRAAPRHGAAMYGRIDDANSLRAPDILSYRGQTIAFRDKGEQSMAQTGSYPRRLPDRAGDSLLDAAASGHNRRVGPAARSGFLYIDQHCACGARTAAVPRGPARRHAGAGVPAATHDAGDRSDRFRRSTRLRAGSTAFESCSPKADES